MALPWILLQLLAPRLPEIISTVRNIKNKRRGEQSSHGASDARLADMEKALEEQLRLITQLTAEIERLQKSVVFAIWAALFALVLSLLALGLLVFQ
jgi:hypothetical protein